MKKILFGNPFTKFLVGTLCVVVIAAIGVFGYLFSVYNPDGLQPLTSSAARNQYAVNSVLTPPINTGGDVCTEQNPTVNVSPTSQSTYPGGPIQYAITVTNTGCIAHSYTIDAKKPSANWVKTFSAFKMANLASTQSQTVNLTMSSPGTIGNGTYPIEITVSTVSNGTTYETEATALYIVADPVVESFRVTGNGAVQNGDNVTVQANSTLIISWRCANTITSNLKNDHGYTLAQGGNSANFKKQKTVGTEVDKTYTVTCYGGPNFTGHQTSRTLNIATLSAQ